MNPIDFRGQRSKVKVTMEIYWNKLVKARGCYALRCYIFYRFESSLQLHHTPSLSLTVMFLGISVTHPSPFSRGFCWLSHTLSAVSFQLHSSVAVWHVDWNRHKMWTVLVIDEIMPRCFIYYMYIQVLITYTYCVLFHTCAMKFSLMWMLLIMYFVCLAIHGMCIMADMICLAIWFTIWLTDNA